MAARRKLLLTLLQLLDLFLVATSFVVALAVTQDRHAQGWLPILEMRVKVRNVLFLVAYFGLWHLILRTCGLYRSYRLSTTRRELRDLATAAFLATAPLLLLGPACHFEYVTVVFLLALSCGAFAGLSMERTLLRAISRCLRRHGRNLRNVVIIGATEDARNLMLKLDQRGELGYRVIEMIEPESGADGNCRDDDPLARLEVLLEQTPVDEVFVTLPLDAWQPLVARLLAICEVEGVTVRLMTHLAFLSWARPNSDALEDQPVLAVCAGPGETPALLVKRVIDIVGASVGLVLCAPIFFVVAAAIKRDSPGPVLFAQERVGFNRRRFHAYKFRTMIVGAESKQAELEHLNEAQGPVFKITEDPRVTRLGRWLRQLSIDELPQLFNVLMGDMSLVGPRPLPVRDVKRIDVRWHKRRFSVKPGITCLWQVNGREPKFDEWIRSDMDYIDNWSLGLDLKILAKTIPAVLSRQGAH
jgi:exopolysaccharide biosynthesis polyprenyl glycosylphosphotransferase